MLDLLHKVLVLYEQGTGFDPCTDNYIFNYLNLPEVQSALHANVTNLPGPWNSCKYAPISYTIFELNLPSELSVMNNQANQLMLCLNQCI